MDKIYFKVSGQSLMKTGGLSTYASDTVEYIQAEFTLSDEWKEYDSVRAIWQNGDIVAPPSVLDSEGKCLVPFEVLTERGRVTVNLVGSSANGIILAKRITSYLESSAYQSAHYYVSSNLDRAFISLQNDTSADMIIQACAKLANPITVNLTPEEIKLLLGNNTIWSDGPVTMIYNADVTRWIQKKLNT